MARKHRNDPRPGDDDFIPLTDTERRAHADALTHAHEGHQCADRAEALCQAAEYYAMLDEHELAEQRFRDALDIGDADPGSVHAFYASFLLDRGRDDEALAMIAEARKLRPENPDVFAVIGEALAEHSHLQQAIRWFTAGLVEQLGHLTDLDLDDLRYNFDLANLARGRYQARQALDMPPDHIDLLAQEINQIKAASVDIH